MNQTLNNDYANSVGKFYLSIDTPSYAETFVCGDAQRVQCGFTGGASHISEIGANSTLSVATDADHATVVASWRVHLKESQDQNTYPLGFTVDECLSGANYTITNGGDYYFVLNETSPPPPPPPPPPSVTPGDVILVGDSLTAFGGTYLDDVFPGELVVNMGVSGATTTSTLAKIAAGDYTTYDPETFVVLIGTNNIPNEDAATTAAGVEAVVNGLRTLKPDADVKMLTIAPRYDFDFAGTDCNTKITAVNAAIAGLDNGTTIRVIDIHDAPEFAGESTGYAGFQGDHIHWSSAGYAAVHDIVDEAINGTPPPPPTSMNVTFSIAGGSPVTVSVPVGETHTIPFTIKLEA